MFGKNQKPEKKGKSKNGIFSVFVLLFGGLILFLKKSKRLDWFLKNQKREIKELNSGQETFGRFLVDSKDLFIPYDGNDNKPRILRPKALLTYATLALVLKLIVVAFLFTVYPNAARLSEIVANRMVGLVNQARAESGAEPLTFDNSLAQAALAKGQDMLAQQYFAHDTPDGKRPWQWIDRSQYDYVYAGENLAMDFTSAELVQDAFMKSPSHRKNILNPRYKDIGIAVLSGELNGHETILLVEFFGTIRDDLDTLVVAEPEPNIQTAPAVENPAAVNAAPTPNQPAVAGEQTEGEVLPLAPDQADLEAGSANEGVIVVSGSSQQNKALIDFVIEYSNIFFIAFLIFILISLFLNIFINIKVQHSSVILQTVAVAALMLAMVLIKFHFVEQVATQILIL
ncbi:MAG: hypothetical protein A3A24_00370 [Candidatus Buchananbacteria bacterium RIFCSPLOWO2_01_FULL_46_12]|uniref:SCP domain-containing protein n=2 Tax=Candidatus Buchananiibacteriota TaxID=1817903 RepID=A0A1G1YTS7_9BACT|nr:MAG: hypothetical protein A2744_02850 [Candidatus Buchananbacteria bacterium RIFCSPHIGHO2_01_FULL_44_11]OGY55176.1 MAG: hypothetical protein A3A24_00370 [Candidatus Buchananbacteria bacterium RIFCSPLOWO2_01_FULL_46_12]